MRAPYLDDGDVRLYLGDVLDVLREMDAESVQTCVTSPPYWGLRDYGEAGQIGLEPTPAEYVARLVDVFREVRRVLRDDGTLWLNLGDSYAASQSSDSRTSADRAKSSTLGPGRDGLGGANAAHLAVSFAPRPRDHGLKPKDLVGIPWRVAFALQDDGWWLRSDIVWSKPNPMPESITDRPTRSHEYVFLLTKSARYFYDHIAVREPLTSTPEQYLRAGKSVRENHAFGAVAGRPLGPSSFATVPDGRNARSVWTITTKPYKGAHFATFPPDIPERCIKAGTPEAGCCAKCGSPLERIIVATGPDGRTAEMRGGKAHDADGKPLMGDNMMDHGVRGSWNSGGHVLKKETAGFRPSCDCDAETVPAVVLDPFSGAATTTLVARSLGRRAVGIELNAEYLDISAKRLSQLSLLSQPDAA